MMRCALVRLAIVLLATAPVLAAQRADSLRVGAQIRIDRWQPARESYRGIYRTRDTLTLVVELEREVPELVGIPIRDIGTVEMLVGHRTGGQAFGRGAGRGALVGLGASAVLMTMAVISDRRDGNDVWISAKAVAAVFSVVLTGATTLVGGAIGSAHRDIWQEVPYRP